MSAPDLPLQALRVDGPGCECLDPRGLLPEAAWARLPRTVRLLFENVAHHAPGQLAGLVEADGCIDREREVDFHPGRLLMHDTTCLPALADFAAMRDAVAELGGDASRINPVIPVDLVIDHSVSVEHHGSAQAAELNLEVDFRRNAERYRFVKWAQQALARFRVMPPGSGILHQINLECLAQVVAAVPRGSGLLLRGDTLVGTDSHTPMINALGVLGWGVGGVEAQSAMLGEPVSMTVPAVTGVRLHGRLAAGVNATDLALHLTAMLREAGVVGRFVEFLGPGVAALTLADRTVVSNMAPEYGATCAWFPIDGATLDYLAQTGRDALHLRRIRAWAEALGLWSEAEGGAVPVFDTLLELDLATVGTVVAGPRHPHERRPLAAVRSDFRASLAALAPKRPGVATPDGPRRFAAAAGGPELRDGLVALAAITSCTNTSNPALLIAAGLLARNAVRRGLARAPWVKASLSPGSRAVALYLQRAGLIGPLEQLGFHVVGQGCMTCIGNSGPLLPEVAAAVEREGLAAFGVLSGNRNFDGRVNVHLAGAYLASPPLVVAWAIAGSVDTDLSSDPLGVDAQGREVRLADLWPEPGEIDAAVREHVDAALLAQAYRGITEGDARWQAIASAGGLRFEWDPRSDYIRRPPYFDAMHPQAPGLRPLVGAAALLRVGDDITTDHISPAGTIPAGSLAGRYLLARGTAVADLNQYSTRRSNHEVLLRGAFSNPRLLNELADPASAQPGRQACDPAGACELSAWEAAAQWREAGVPLVIFAGQRYGAGSSRDWAAKAPALLGVRAVVAGSFERIHRSNLLALGVVPLTFADGLDRSDVCSDPAQRYDFIGLDALRVGMNRVRLLIRQPGLPGREAELACRIESGRELDWLRHAGVLPGVVRRAVAAS